MIGIFDSGVGGLSVWKELITILPTERYYYISDAAYCPYGPKEKSFVEQRCIELSNFLIKQGAEIIVVACNTATAAAIQTLREKFSIPFVGMEPAVKPAAFNSKSGVIGVLATEGTFKGNLYINTSNEYAKKRDVKVIETVGEGLVEIVENDLLESSEAENLIKKYVLPMIEQGADNIVLGCTHYPFLSDIINKVSNNRLKIYNPAPAIARRTKELLGLNREFINPNLSKDYNIISTTGSSTTNLKKIANSILNKLKSTNLLSSGELTPFVTQKFLLLDKQLK